MALPMASAFGFSGVDWGAALIERDWAKSDAQRQYNWSMDASNTAWQRGVADMQAAGLNPMLAYSQGPATSPGGAPTRGVSMPVASASMGFQTGAQTELTRAQAERTRSETMSNEKLAEKLQAEIDYILTQRGTSSSQMNVNQQHAALLREQARVALQEAESAERFLLRRNAAELDIILATATGMRTEGAIDDSQYGVALRYIQRGVKAVGSALGGAVGGVVGGFLGRRSGQGVRPPRQTSADYFRGLRRE